MWISLAVSNFGWWIFESNRLHLCFALCWGEQTTLWTNTIFTQRVFSPHWRSPRAPAYARGVLLGLGTVPARWSCGERARPGPPMAAAAGSGRPLRALTRLSATTAPQQRLRHLIGWLGQVTAVSQSGVECEAVLISTAPEARAGLWGGCRGQRLFFFFSFFPLKREKGH